MNPPTTLIVAMTNAMKANQDAVPGSPLLNSALESISAPTIVIPHIALAPDIRGVCNVGGTLLINSKPRKIAKTKTVMLATSVVIVNIWQRPPTVSSA